MDYRGKRLLVLGGTQSTYDVVVTAQQMGLYVICVDNLDTGISKSIANESYKISTDDFQSLLLLIKDKHVNGIFTGASEFNTRNMIELSKLADLPCYCSINQWDIMQNKRNFKSTCIRYGVPVVQEYSENEEIEYPVVVKPTDNCSSRGLSVCRDKKHLSEAIEFAKQYSNSKTVIIERLMKCDNIVSYYTVQDGTVSLSAIGDWYKFENKDGIDAITSAIVFPSIRLVEYRNKMTDCVNHMINGIGVKNGVLNLQMFYENGNFYVYECCLRISGTQEYNLIAPINGINNLSLMIQYAVSGKMGDESILDYDNPSFSGRCACNLAIMLKPGKITSITGVDRICANKAVLHMSAPLTIGDEILDSDVGTLGQTFCRFHLVTESKDFMKSLITYIYDNLHIVDGVGQNMIYAPIDASSI